MNLINYRLLSFIFNTMLTIIKGISQMAMYMSKSRYILFIFGLVFAFEIINRWSYHKFVKKLKNKKMYNFNIFCSTNENIMRKYSTFMKKHFINDKIYDIYKTYYIDGIMTLNRIRNVIKHYIYNLDETIYVSKDIPCELISIHKTVNQLTNQLERMYIVSDGNEYPETFHNWLNIASLVRYENVVSKLIKCAEYLRFATRMKVNKFKYNDITDNLRLWIRNDHHVNNLVLLNNCDITSLNINNDDIYVEVKGFTYYYDAFNLITFDIFNTYFSIDGVVREFSKIYDMYDNIKLNICASDIMTIFVPHLVNKYDKHINSIFIKNPIFYPYSYHYFYKNLHKTSFTYRPNIMYVLHGNSLIDTFMDLSEIDKNSNKLYNHKTHIVFDYDTDYIDISELAVLLKMYSRVDICDDILDIQLKNIEINNNNNLNMYK